MSISEIEVYTLMIELRRTCIKTHDDFVKHINALIQLHDKNDPRNIVRICPYCGLIWIKTEGCEGITYCGNLTGNTTTKVDRSNKPFLKFLISWIDGKLFFKKNEIPKSYLDVSVATTSSRKGCGKQIEWGKLNRFSEEVIKTLFPT